MTEDRIDLSHIRPARWFAVAAISLWGALCVFAVLAFIAYGAA